MHTQVEVCREPGGCTSGSEPSLASVLPAGGPRCARPTLPASSNGPGFLLQGGFGLIKS